MSRVKAAGVDAVIGRLSGREASRTKSAIAALVAGVLVYRILRSGSGADEAAAEGS